MVDPRTFIIVASPEQHELLYPALRAKVLTRHFAIERYFRVNLLSLSNTVEELPTAVKRLIDPTRRRRPRQR